MNTIEFCCAIVLLKGFAACQPQVPPPIRHGVASYRDSVIETGRAMYQLVHVVDSLGRSDTTLPISLDRVVSTRESHSNVDLWGRELHYTVNGLEFELRSTGRDGVEGSPDDIVVLGRLGRERPCELRDEFVRLQYERVAPLCAQSPVRVLPVCTATDSLMLDPDAHFAEEGDSVTATGSYLVRVARRVDAMGRRLGGLPPTPLALNPDLLLDAWRRPLRYTPDNGRFEIRSAGLDGTLGGDDDIVVEAELGQPITCAFRQGRETMRCDDPAPGCPPP